MTIIDDLTPVYYGLQKGKLIVRGTTTDELDFKLLVTFYNADEESLDSRYIPLTFTTAQKQAFIDAIVNEIDALETATGLTRYEPPESPLP